LKRSQLNVKHPHETILYELGGMFNGRTVLNV